MKKVFLALTMVTMQLFSVDIVEEAFTFIYENHVWGSNPSGGGSLPKNLNIYMKLLNDFITTYKIESICDLGSGDFSYMQKIDLSHIDYTGVEIVKELVEINNAKFGTGHLRFVHGNIIEIELPDAELAICKHVLQHLPNEAVLQVLEKLKKYKYCLLVDQFKSPTAQNSEIEAGGGRPLDLLLPPFNVHGTVIGKFMIDGWNHRVLLVKN